MSEPTATQDPTTTKLLPAEEAELMEMRKRYTELVMSLGNAIVEEGRIQSLVALKRREIEILDASFNDRVRNMAKSHGIEMTVKDDKCWVFDSQAMCFVLKTVAQKS